MEYYPFELHCHTNHSDGDFTVEELCRAAKHRNLIGVALTDHNTYSGVEKLYRQDLVGIKGIEWTTFYGHMLVLGGTCFVDWRNANVDNIDEKLMEIKEKNGIVGIAHPFEIGYPICTGGYWEFKVKQWELIDYIEVWSNPAPMMLSKNKKALEWWTHLLNQGYHISCTAGRDWHRNEEPQELVAVTYLGIEGKVNEYAALEAIRNGRIYLSLGPTLVIQVVQNNKCYQIGDSLNSGEFHLSIKIENHHTFTLSALKIICNGNINKELIITQEGNIVFLDTLVTIDRGWFRLELYGEGESLLAITSPYYVLDMN